MTATLLVSARRRRPMLIRILGAALVFRLELRSPQPLDVGLILLAWLRRPAIEMPMRAHESRSDRLRRRLDEVYPF
ncbi:MAG: hypothetical protein VCE12_09130 [Candidatus Latescibacterota bacterium]